MLEKQDQSLADRLYAAHVQQELLAQELLLARLQAMELEDAARNNHNVDTVSKPLKLEVGKSGEATVVFAYSGLPSVADSPEESLEKWFRIQLQISKANTKANNWAREGYADMAAIVAGWNIARQVDPEAAVPATVGDLIQIRSGKGLDYFITSLVDDHGRGAQRCQAKGQNERSFSKYDVADWTPQ